MRVLHLTTWQETCGIAGYAGDLVEALGRLGVESEVHPVRLRERKYLSPAEIREDLDACLVRAREFDLVHVQHEYSFFGSELADSFRLLGRLLRGLSSRGVPAVVTFHSEAPFGREKPLRTLLEPPLSARLAERALSRAWRRHVSRRFRAGGTARALVHTRRTRQGLLLGGFDPAAVEVLPMGMPERRSSTLALPREEAKARLGFPADTILLSVFGFLSAYKGQELAGITVAHALPARYRLAAVGGPHPEAPGEGTLEKLVGLRRAMGADADRIRITGFVPFETLDLYHAATDFCLAPYLDLPISGSAAITWALTAGRPVVASAIPTFRELNEDGDCLALFGPGNANELAWHVERLAANPAEQHRLVENARRFVDARRWSVVAKRVLAVYEELCARTPLLRRVLRVVGSGPARTLKPNPEG